MVALLAPLLLLFCSGSAEEETSDAYLRNVVGELRILNGFGPSTTTQLPPPVDISFSDSQIQPIYQEHHEPTMLGLTTRELAAMYRKAIELGSPLKYQALVNRLNRPKKVYGTRFQPVTDTGAVDTYPDYGYAYYFYPLQAFQHELTDQQQSYQTISANSFQQYDVVPAENKKEMSSMSPILVGISSFLGMAAMFVMSLFLYPRLVHYMNFPFASASSRMTNEVAYLTAFVREAIDHFEKYQGNRRRVRV